MAMQVAIDSIPALARPAEVEQAISDARTLRDRARQSAEQVAQTQEAVDDAIQQDTEAAALRARAGEPLGAEGKAVAKARGDLLAAQRTLNVTRLAQQGAEDDVGRMIIQHGADWTAALTEEAERAREAARASIAALQDATRRLADALSAENWVDSAIDEQRFDRPVRGVVAASAAPSSRHRTANGEALTIAEILGFAAELVDGPTSTQTSEPPLVQTPQS